jgi:hypothetical protein
MVIVEQHFEGGVDLFYYIMVKSPQPELGKEKSYDKKLCLIQDVSQTITRY